MGPGDESESRVELDGGHDVSIMDAAEIEAYLGGGRENDCDALDRDDLEEEEEEVEVLSASTFHGTIQEDLSRLLKEIESKVKMRTQQASFAPTRRVVEKKEVGTEMEFLISIETVVTGQGSPKTREGCGGITDEDQEKSAAPVQQGHEIL